jgi:thioredoxin reductase (NADPH)
VTIIHQFDEFQAEPATAKEALESPKIKVMWSHEPRAFLGETALQKLRVENLKTKQTSELPTDGVFVFVGMVPRTELLKGLVPLDRWGCVETDDSMQTSVPGLFVAGDIRAKKFRQITTAVADGTIAALAAQKYLREAR